MIPQVLPVLPDLPPLLARIFAARGIASPTHLEKNLRHLLPFSGLKDIEKAVQRLAQALQENHAIMVIGDFDADGATATTLAVSALRQMGAQNVSFLVPNRFIYGYGLTPNLVDLAATSKPDLLITVDNGMSSIEGVAHANSLNMDVVITDHHLAGEILPEAYAIVNPNQPADSFESKSIAGVGVIFYVMLALRRHLETQGWFQEKGLEVPNMAQYLDLVALGTVADVVALDRNNRILVHQGLLRIKQGFARPGIAALLQVAKKEPQNLKASDLGFSIAPRLNAAGRLDDMRRGIQCLLAETETEATQYAMELDTLNDERRLIEQDMKTKAFAALEALSSQLEGQTHPAGLCLCDDWHQGVIGILAGRLKEAYHRPVIVFAKVSETELKGSGRSVNEVNIRDILAEMAQAAPDLITKFGGHAMAAGLSIHPSQFPAFKKAFAETVARYLPLEKCEGVLFTDGELAAEELTLHTANLLEEAGPFGQQFPEPLFEGIFHIVQQRLVGQKHLKLTLKPLKGQQFIDAIAFNVDLSQWPNHRLAHVKTVYALDKNRYQGVTRLQLLVHHLEAVQNADYEKQY